MSTGNVKNIFLKRVKIRKKCTNLSFALLNWADAKSLMRPSTTESFYEGEVCVCGREGCVCVGGGRDTRVGLGEGGTDGARVEWRRS